MKVDEAFYDHPKFDSLSLAEWGLWLSGLAYSNRNRLDGVVRRQFVERLRGRKQAAGLVDAGLWSVHPEGFEIHDYLDYQRSAEQIDELSAKRAAAGRQGGTKKAANAKQIAKQTPTKSLPEEDGEEDRDREPSVLKASTPSKQRPRDLLYDALVEACRYNPDEITKSMGNRIGVARAQLAALGATPDEVIRRANNARRMGWPNSRITPTSIAANWPALAQVDRGGGRASSADDAAERVADAITFTSSPQRAIGGGR